MKLAYISHRFPALPQTFTHEEILGLVEAGCDVHVYSMRKPGPGDPAPLFDAGRVHYLPPCWSAGFWWRAFLGGFSHPIMVLSLLCDVLTHGYSFSPVRRRLLGVLSVLRACVLHCIMKADGRPDHIHAQFPMEAATSTMGAARMDDIPWSFTSHTSNDPPLMPQKLESATCVVSISQFDKARLIEKCGEQFGSRIYCIYLGIRPDDWPFAEALPANTNILSVGALTAKKGHLALVDACAQLRAKGENVTCTVVGDGPQRADLEERIARNDLDEFVQLAGALSLGRVRGLLRESRVFALACERAPNGDSDGLPRVLMEAMAAGVPCVSTRFVAIPELIEDELNGLLVEPGNAGALAGALSRVLADASLANKLRVAGHAKVLNQFNLERNIASLAELLARHAN